MQHNLIPVGAYYTIIIPEKPTPTRKKDERRQITNEAEL